MLWESATKKQLIQICKEDCPVHFKYRAASELQRRNKLKGHIIELWDAGYDTDEIAEIVNINRHSVHGIMGEICGGKL